MKASEKQPWHDAGIDASYAFWRYSRAKTPAEQANAFVELSNAMSDMTSWLPGYDDNCTMPWERGEDIESNDDLYT